MNNIEIQNINKFLQDNKENIINDIRDLVAIPSVSENLPKVKECLKTVICKAEKMGFKAYTVLDDSIGIVEMGDGTETIGILTHIDVVPADDLDKWNSNPFEMVEKDGVLFGRGVLDDKGCIVSSLYAMDAIRKLNLPINKKVQLIIGTQEEVEWVDMNEYIEKYPLPDYGFTPDGQFPICNKEKGYADVAFKFTSCTCCTGDFEITKLQSGNATNSVPGVATAILKGDLNKFKDSLNKYLALNKDAKITFSEDGSVIKVVAEGVSGHSAFPHLSINPIVMLGKFLNTLSIVSNSRGNAIKFIAENCYDYFGKGLGVYSKSEYLDGEYMHRNVISPTVVKEDDSHCTVILNMRPVYGTTLEGLKEIFTKISNETKSTFEVLDFLAPIFVSKEKPFLQIMENTYNELSGLKNDFTLGHGTSYAKAMPNTVAWGPVFYDEDECCHVANEFISLEKLFKATEIYSVALGRMLEETKPLI